MEKKCWYKEMAVYQIWCRSFCDGTFRKCGSCNCSIQKRQRA